MVVSVVRAAVYESSVESGNRLGIVGHGCSANIVERILSDASSRACGMMIWAIGTVYVVVEVAAEAVSGSGLNSTARNANNVHQRLVLLRRSLPRIQLKENDHIVACIQSLLIHSQSQPQQT